MGQLYITISFSSNLIDFISRNLVSSKVNFGDPTLGVSGTNRMIESDISIRYKVKLC